MEYPPCLSFAKAKSLTTNMPTRVARTTSPTILALMRGTPTSTTLGVKALRPRNRARL